MSSTLRFLALACFISSCFALPRPAPIQQRIALVPNGMTVSWSTVGPLSVLPSVTYGLSPSLLTSTATGYTLHYSPAVTYFHHVVLTGLQPHTVYYWQPLYGNSSSILSFTTAPEVGDHHPFTIAINGDMGLVNEDNTVAAMTQWIDRIDLFWHIGDLNYADDSFLYGLTYETATETWMNRMTPIYSQRPYMMCPGNHDITCNEVLPGLCPSGQRNVTSYLQRYRMPAAESGAINNLSFNIRKDWKTVPAWLQPFINADAHQKGVKEMTVVGRACISCWIVEMIFDRYFHPGIEPDFSSQLKIIEKNIRRYAAPPQSLEEEEALRAKVMNWRLATLDGLQDSMARPEALEYRAELTQNLVGGLIAELQKSLTDPPPPGLEGGVTGIVELAVAIASNLPLESREVFVDYPRPGALVVPEHSTVESGLPPLTNPGPGSGPGLESSGGGHDVEKTSSVGSGSADSSSSQQATQPGEGKDPSSPSLESRDELSLGINKDQPVQAQQQQQQQKKKGMFGGLMSKKPAPAATNVGQQGAGSDGGGGKSDSGGVEEVGQQQQQQQQGGNLPGKDEAKEEMMKRVRVAAFMAVLVRGRSVLVPAPVWTL